MRIRVLSLLALLVALVFDAGQMRLPRAQAEGAASTGLTLRCNPGQADIFVDGEKVGQTPLSGPLALSAGEHTIRLLPPLYLEETRGLPAPGGPAPAAGAYDKQSLTGLDKPRRQFGSQHRHNAALLRQDRSV